MTAVDVETAQDFFSRSKTLHEALLELCLETLPHPKLRMFLERVSEMQQALRYSVKKNNTIRSGGVASRRSRHRDVEPIVLTARHLFKILRILKKSILADVAHLEKYVNCQEFPILLQTARLQLRGLTRDVEQAVRDAKGGAVSEKHLSEMKVIFRFAGQIKKTVDALNAWAEPRFLLYLKEFEKIFKILERTDDSFRIGHYVKYFFRGTAYKHIASSGIIDKEYCENNLKHVDFKNKDVVTAYLATDADWSPAAYFDAQYYRETYEEVRKLRYDPLEHFVRYGEALRYNPSADVDVRFYLKSNVDVLEAGVSAYRHFAHHGFAEGRPPKARAGGFFIRDYRSDAAVRVAFVGDPGETARSAWEVVRSRCLARPGSHAERLAAADLARGAAAYDAVVIGSDALRELPEEVLLELSRNEVRLVWIGDHPQDALQRFFKSQVFPLDRLFAVTADYAGFIRWQEEKQPLRLLYYPFDDPDDAAAVAEALLNALSRKQACTLKTFDVVEAGRAPDKPLISVVSIIYKKCKELLAFLESLNRQDIADPYEVVLVDDASPDDTLARVEAWLEEKRASGHLNRHMRVEVLRNAVNSGNCLSRNRGIEAAQADVVLVADGDMVFGLSNLREHARAYRFGDCDAVLGFFRFDLNYEFVFHWLAACELDPRIVRQKLLTLDSWITARRSLSFLGCGVFDFVTRNISFRKSALSSEYFDLDFSYSARPDSGYGAEDQELGARMYFGGKRIRFVEQAIASHIRHGDNSYNDHKAFANMINWNKLIAKYPDLKLVDRQFYQGYTVDLLNRAASRKDTPQYKTALATYSDPGRANVTIRPQKSLRILTYTSNAVQQYAMCKMGRHAFTFATAPGLGDDPPWDRSVRPTPANATFKSLEDIDVKDYDFAILPFDEDDLCHAPFGAGARGRRLGFLTMLEATKALPRAAVCCASPQGHAACSGAFGDDDPAFVESRRQSVCALLTSVHVVCTSYQAQKAWGFARSCVIWPGFSPAEFPPGGGRRACALTFAKACFDCFPGLFGQSLLEEWRSSLGLDHVVHAQPPAAHPGYAPGSREWAVANFQNHVGYLGEFMAFLDPTSFVPMPTLRGEAMTTGAIPLSLNNHDVALFIKNGVNGFYGESAQELAEYWRWLTTRPQEQSAMRRNARLTALDVFNIDRHVALWSDLLSKLM